MKTNSKFTLILYLSVATLFFITKTVYSQQFTIGQKHRGGIVFYLDSTGKHGLIAATVDQGKTQGANRIGTSQSDKAIYAKRVCSYYTTTVNDVTYHTWYLPSITELKLLYKQKDIVGGFQNDQYWSSSYNERYGFRLLNFSDGSEALSPNAIAYIRPIQEF